MFPTTLPSPIHTVPDAIPGIALAMSPELGTIAAVIGTLIVGAGLIVLMGAGRLRRQRRSPGAAAPSGVTA
jgi:predicted benzoate:H+ symporter BenE